MPGQLMWGWDSDNEEWKPLKVDSTGSIQIACTVDYLDDIGDVAVPTPSDGDVLYWDDGDSKWKAKANWVAAHKTSHQNGGADEINVGGLSGLLADDQHVLDAEAVAAMGAKADDNPLHHDKYTDAQAKAAAVLAGAITDGETKAPTHDAVYDVKVTADAAQTEAEVAAAIDADIATHAADKDAHHSNVLSLTFIIDGGGSAITTGQKGHLEIPFACTISQVTLLADQSGSIVIDIWKVAYADFPPADGNSITASAPPTISSTQKSQDSTLTDWTTAIAAGDILAFNVDSCTTIERVTLSLRVTKT